MKHEMERLHKALCESEAECSSLREKLSALQREFISEEPTPPLPSTGAQVRIEGIFGGGRGEGGKFVGHCHSFMHEYETIYKF